MEPETKWAHGETTQGTKSISKETAQNLFDEFVRSRKVPLDESFRLKQQNFIDHWDELTPESQQNYTNTVTSITAKPLPGWEERIRNRPVGPTPHQESDWGLLWVLLGLVCIFVFIIGLVAIFSGGLKN